MDFTYKFPDPESFLYTLQTYLEHKEHPEISVLLEDTTCSFSSTDQYTRHRWNELWADLIIAAPVSRLDEFTEGVREQIADAANEVMPTDAGYRVTVAVTPKLLSPEAGRRKKRTVVDERLCFVIMSFSGLPTLQDFYEQAIKPTVESLGYHCERVDEQEFNGSIRTRILQNIESARFVIADLTQAKPNCYYELGIAHALGKEVIHLANNIGDVHFDVKDFNFIVYDRIEALKKRLRSRILSTVGYATADDVPFEEVPF